MKSEKAQADRNDRAGNTLDRSEPLAFTQDIRSRDVEVLWRRPVVEEEVHREEVERDG